MTFNNYISFILCVFLTVITLIVIGFAIWLGWAGLIEPIMDRVKEQKDTYWKDKYRKARSECEELNKKLRRIGLGDDFVSCLDGYYGPNNSGEYKDEHTPKGYVHVMVKFTLKEDRFNKIKEEQDKIFRGERI